jgi:hypothetical protein
MHDWRVMHGPVVIATRPILVPHYSGNPLSTVGTSVARSSGSLYSLSGQSPIGNPLLTLVDVASRSWKPLLAHVDKGLISIISGDLVSIEDVVPPSKNSHSSWTYSKQKLPVHEYCSWTECVHFPPYFRPQCVNSSLTKVNKRPSQCVNGVYFVHWLWIKSVIN